jgi:hypothetical protein
LIVLFGSCDFFVENCFEPIEKALDAISRSPSLEKGTRFILITIVEVNRGMAVTRCLLIELANQPYPHIPFVIEGQLVIHNFDDTPDWKRSWKSKLIMKKIPPTSRNGG